MLLDSYTEEEESRKHESLKRSQKRFIDQVLQDWAAEIQTEAAVTLEFMDQTHRDSIYNYAQSEEISELMEDAYRDSFINE